MRVTVVISVGGEDEDTALVSTPEEDTFAVLEQHRVEDLVRAILIAARDAVTAAGVPRGCMLGDAVPALHVTLHLEAPDDDGPAPHLN